MGTPGVGFDRRRAVDVFLRKYLVDCGFPCVDRVRVVPEPRPGNVGGGGDGDGESDSLFISPRRFDGALVLDERSSRVLLFYSGDCFGAGLDHALEFPDVQPASPIHVAVKEL